MKMSEHSMNSQICFEPIQRMQFKGLHWIEASAGTGKTYTLSSLMVRIFLKDYLPNQVIATTFTRAAAAELKSRIRLRLIEAQQYFQACLDDELSENAIQEKIDNEHDPLLKHILAEYRHKVAYASSRLQLVIEQLDELFVGTLDSFSQKLLREFSFESGKVERAEISDRSQTYVEQLTHDVLREWIQAQPQSLIEILLANKRLYAADQYASLVNTTLNFASVPLQHLNASPLELQTIERLLQEIAGFTTTDIEELAEYYQGVYASNFPKNIAGTDAENLKKIFLSTLPKLIEALQHQPLEQWFNPLLQPKWNEVFHLYLKKDGDWRSDLFNKPSKTCTAENQDFFRHHRILVALKHLIEAKDVFEQQLDQIESQLKLYLVQEVKQRLPQLLQQKGETTFSQQIRTLAEALKGEQGQRFAQFVHARYPLILVDEFQDTNQDQDDMLASIWRNDQWYARGCMIMVGDPKQAIYGFRGGDMLTYNNARDDVVRKQGVLYSLAQNHRSVTELVSVVDELFQRDCHFGENVVYQKVTAGARPHPALIDQQQINPMPFRWVNLAHDEQEAIKIAWKIQDLLNQGREKTLYFDRQGEHVAVQEDDIAILATSHRSLDAVQYELERLGIRVNRSHKRSVFTGFLAKDVAAILTAILDPYHEAKVKRALLTRLLGFNLNQLVELEKQGLGQFIYDFDCIREIWNHKGFLTAWNYCLNLFKVWENLVAKQSFDNERHVVNLRHLTELLSQQSEYYQGAHTLYYWYLQQVESPGEREWEVERKLSNAAGVQLMSVHQSKGLEFKIVFLMGANEAIKKDKSPLIFSKETSTLNKDLTVEKRVIAIKNATIPEQAQTQHDERRLAEQNRLWYVAVTRASYRIYAMMKEAKPSNTKAVEGAKALEFWSKKPSVSDEHRELAKQLSCVETALLECPVKREIDQPELIKIQALDFPKRRFYPRSKTSFSYLAQHRVVKQLNDSLVVDPRVEARADDENNQPIQSQFEAQLKQPIAWIKENFPKGANAGSFLHKLFENIHFDVDAKQLYREVRHQFRTAHEFQSTVLLAQLLEKLPAELNDAEKQQNVFEQVTDWLQQVLETPLHDGFKLNQLEDNMHLAEFPFYMALSDHRLFIEEIQALFASVHCPIQALNDAATARYLNGSIDLIYFDGQRYHIADYKSNYLGADQMHYQDQEIRRNMTDSSYWLQAALYLVAVHRYLKSTLADYRIETHLGGASYLYLRGMNGQPDAGYHHWKPEDTFILKLDQILGYFEAEKSA